MFRVRSAHLRSLTIRARSQRGERSARCHLRGPRGPDDLRRTGGPNGLSIGTGRPSSPTAPQSQPRGSAVAVRQLLTKRLPWTRELAVAEADGVLKVRVSTERPELAVLTGVECGTLRDVVVESEVVKRAGG